MENEIRDVIKIAKSLKSKGYSDKKLAEFIHIELGKLIVYDNNYTVKNEGYDVNSKTQGKKSKVSVIRQEKILNTKINIRNKEQVCKGMAEITVAVLSEVGIDAKVVGVISKEEVEGQIREDGTVIDVPELYSTSFNNNLEITNKENEKNNDEKSEHYYALIKTDQGEFISDFLTEKALTRIKIGEAQQNNEIPGFHKKDEHRDRSNPNNYSLSKEFIHKMQTGLYEYMQHDENDETKVFEFIFKKLKENVDNFGFEEAKDFIMMFAAQIIPKGMIKQKVIPINLVKEDREKCDILCVYRCGRNNYLIRGGHTACDLPIGAVSNEVIDKALSQGFEPRKLNDAIELQKIKNERGNLSILESAIRETERSSVISEVSEKKDEIENIQQAGINGKNIETKQIS